MASLIEEAEPGDDSSSSRHSQRTDPFRWPLSRVAQEATRNSEIMLKIGILLVCACIGLILPPYFGYRYDGNFWKDMFNSSDMMTSMTIDVIVVLASVFLWIFLDDAKQVGLCVSTLIVLFGCCIVSLSFVVPLYLAFRTLALCTKNHPPDTTTFPFASPTIVIILSALISQLCFVFLS